MGSRENDARRGGRYDLLIGPAESPFGSSWVARSLEADGALVTVRRLGGDLELSADDRDLVLEAAEWARTVSHEGVSPIMDLVVTSTEVGIVQKYQPGVSVRTLLRQCVLRGVTPPVPVVLRLALDVLDVLAGVVPLAREVRPGLSLGCGIVGPDTLWTTKVGRTLLTDLGVSGAARSLGPLAKRAELMAYSAPEQWTGHLDDPKSDLFVLGILIWELLSGGRRLFQGDGESEVRAAVCSEAIAEPPLPGDGHAGVSALVMRALEREPERRWQGPEEMRQALLDLGEDAVAGRAGVLAFVLGLAGKELSAQNDAVAGASERPAIRWPPEPLAVTPRAAEVMVSEVVEKAFESEPVRSLEPPVATIPSMPVISAAVEEIDSAWFDQGTASRDTPCAAPLEPVVSDVDAPEPKADEAPGSEREPEQEDATLLFRTDRPLDDREAFKPWAGRVVDGVVEEEATILFRTERPSDEVKVAETKEPQAVASAGALEGSDEEIADEEATILFRGERSSEGIVEKPAMATASPSEPAEPAKPSAEAVAQAKAPDEIPSVVVAPQPDEEEATVLLRTDEPSKPVSVEEKLEEASVLLARTSSAQDVKAAPETAAATPEKEAAQPTGRPRAPAEKVRDSMPPKAVQPEHSVAASVQPVPWGKPQAARWAIAALVVVVVGAALYATLRPNRAVVEPPPSSPAKTAQAPPIEAKPAPARAPAVAEPAAAPEADPGPGVEQPDRREEASGDKKPATFADAFAKRVGFKRQAKRKEVSRAAQGSQAASGVQPAAPAAPTVAAQDPLEVLRRLEAKRRDKKE